MVENLHGSCVAINNKGVLFLGGSSSGKSDVCLRLIMQKKAVLVADDRVDLQLDNNNNIIANAPQNIAGLLEVRGLGIKKFTMQKDVTLNLAIELVSSYTQIERMPKDEFFEFKNHKIKKIKLYPFEPSAIEKVLLAINGDNSSILVD